MKSSRRKITDRMAYDIRSRNKKGESVKSLASEYGINVEMIEHIVSGRHHSTFGKNAKKNETRTKRSNKFS